jgi:hypothetical protein
MTQPDQSCWRALLGACALVAAAGAHAQSAPAPVSSDANVPPASARQQASEIARGDPARWYRPDTTMAARLRTLQKEIGAGLQEAQGNCRRLRPNGAPAWPTRAPSTSRIRPARAPS